MTGIYVHLPFCPYLCPYCDFAKWPLRASTAQRYLRALEREIARERGVPAETIFLGGGTPNAYGAADLVRLITSLRAAFPHPDGDAHEITVELNPELVRDGDLAAYRTAGVTRLSLGVQSFVPEELRILGRHHAPDLPAAIVRQARAEGFDAVSLDLIFAVPGQTPERWRSSLETAIALEPDHLSTYALTIEDGTPFASWYARDPAVFCSEDVEADLYEIAIEVLERAGYEHYEVSNFARPGKRCRHNENYWRNGEYLGLGVGAASYRAGVRSSHTRDLAAYIESLERDLPVPSEAERLEGEARVGEAVMLALRTSDGVDERAFAQRYGPGALLPFAETFERLCDDGLAIRTGGRLRLTRRGRFLADEIGTAFVTVP